MDHGTISNLIKLYRYNYSNEKELQEGLGNVFVDSKVEYRREVELGEFGTVDFMIDKIGIETKVDEPLSKVTHQLFRYSQSDKVDSLILVTTKRQHNRMPDKMNNKPLTVILIGGLV